MVYMVGGCGLLFFLEIKEWAILYIRWGIRWLFFLLSCTFCVMVIIKEVGEI